MYGIHGLFSPSTSPPQQFPTSYPLEFLPSFLRLSFSPHFQFFPSSQFSPHTRPSFPPPPTVFISPTLHSLDFPSHFPLAVFPLEFYRINREQQTCFYLGQDWNKNRPGSGGGQSHFCLGEERTEGRWTYQRLQRRGGATSCLFGEEHGICELFVYLPFMSG